MAAARGPPARLGSLWSALEDQRGGAQEEVPFLLSSSASWGGLLGAREREKECLLRRGWGAARAGVGELWAFAQADPRKAVFAAKVGLALALISLLVFLREPRDIVSHSVWAILTVVVVFEFSIEMQTNMKDVTQILIKMLLAESKQGANQLSTVINVISNVKHPNVVELIGCCVEGTNRLPCLFLCTRRNAMSKLQGPMGNPFQNKNYSEVAKRAF